MQYDGSSYARQPISVFLPSLLPPLFLLWLLVSVAVAERVLPRS